MLRNIAPVSLIVLVVGLIVALGLATPGSAAVQAIVTIDPNTRFQTMTGWEATDFIGEPTDPSLPYYRDKMLDLAANEIGINRVRLEIKSGSENPRDYYSEYRSGQIDYATWRCVRYSTTNDNADPGSMNASGFHFSELDWKVENVVLPMKSRLEARGEKLLINLEYVAFTSQIRQPGCSSSLTYIHNNPDEYAEFILATTQHMKSKYGLTPDSWEVILEPDNVSEWASGTAIANALRAASARLEGAGFTPRFVVPSAMAMATARSYFDQLAGVLGDGAVRRYVKELAYHRYAAVSDAELQAIAARAAQYGIGGAMLEWWDPANGHETLHKDLTMGRNSAWQQEVLGGLFTLDTTNPTSPKIDIKPSVRLSSQYFMYVREGAVRIGASTTNGAFEPVAFVNTDGKGVVVVKAASAGAFAVQGLGAGTYGITYTTDSQYKVALPDVTIGQGQSLETSIPGSGVITVFGKAGAAATQTPNAPAATPTKTPTSQVPSPTATTPPAIPTSVPVPPTQTVPAPTVVPPGPTATAVPPTATRTPATSTPAPVPPTATVVPPTATPVPPVATPIPAPGAASAATLSASPSSFNPGATARVSWAGLPDSNVSYWVELYRQEGSSAWVYVGGAEFAAGGRSAGSASFKMPATPGTYEFRLMSASEKQLAASRKLTVRNNRTK